MKMKYSYKLLLDYVFLLFLYSYQREDRFSVSNVRQTQQIESRSKSTEVSAFSGVSKPHLIQAFFN